MCDGNVIKERLTFLYSSINDMQATIRAVDSKLNFIIVILMVPLTKLNAMYSHISTLLKNHNGFLSYFLVSLFILFWGLALIATIRGLSSIDNPSERIDPIGQGSFYAPYFKFTMLDAFINQVDKKPDKSINEIVKFLPKSLDDMQNELAFEQLKLSYIRGIKIIRQRYAYRFLLFWMLAGGIIWLWTVLVRP